MQRSEPYASPGSRGREQQHPDRRETRPPFPESSLRPLAQHDHRPVARYNFQPSEEFCFAGDFPDMPIAEILGAEIQREDVIRLHDEMMRPLPGFWVVTAGQQQLLSFGSCKVMVEHHWPQPLMIDAAPVRRLLQTALKAFAGFKAISNFDLPGHLTDLVAGPGEEPLRLPGQGAPCKWILESTTRGRSREPGPQDPGSSARQHSQPPTDRTRPPANHNPASEYPGSSPWRQDQAPVPHGRPSSAPAYRSPGLVDYSLAPAYYSPAPAYQSRPPAYRGPAPAYQTRPPAYHGPAPAYQSRHPVFHGPAPQYPGPSPWNQRSGPGYQG